MKKVLVTITILLFVSTLSFAQVYKKGVTNLNAGVSIGSVLVQQKMEFYVN